MAWIVDEAGNLLNLDHVAVILETDADETIAQVGWGPQARDYTLKMSVAKAALGIHLGVPVIGMQQLEKAK